MKFKTINVYRAALAFSLKMNSDDAAEFLRYGFNVGFYRETRFGWPEYLAAMIEMEIPVEDKIRKAIAGKFYQGEKAMAKAGAEEVIRILAEELDLNVTRNT